ncbi:MAG: hypothetical protein CL928_18900 [Deltaproteobacteria bacterium]|nr:hypothetical protein [Deltaproteobacteria bacterium]
MIIPDLLRRAAEKNVGRVAVVVDGVGSMTYTEWEERSNRLARALVERGVTPDDRVMFLFSNFDGLDFLICYQAIHKAGCVAVPVNTRFSESELRHVIDHCEPRALLHGDEFETLVASTLGSTCNSTEAHSPELLLATEDIRTLASKGDASRFQVSRTDDDLADILYTSGTTGTPKGVACTHGNVTHKGSSQLSSMFRNATYLHSVPLFTFAGTHAMTLICLRGGMQHLLLPKFEPGRFLELLAEHKVNLTYAVPTMLLRCLDHPRIRQGGFEALSLLMYGTAPMPPWAIQSLSQHLPSTMLINLYGLTEGGGTVCSLPPDEALRRPDSIGRPLPPAEVRIVGEDGTDCPAGVPGEILMKGGVRPRWYYKDQEASREAWTEDGWLRTGDIGSLDADGYLYLVDRKKDLIIVGGHNVSAPAVESALMEHDAVLEAAVIGVQHRVMGEVPKAFVVLRPDKDSPLSDQKQSEAAEDLSESLEAFLRARLADYKVPREYQVLGELPRNALGKVLKRELRAFGTHSGTEGAAQ